MDEIEKAKLLAAALSLTKHEIQKLRKEILEEITYPVFPESQEDQEPILIEGPPGKDGLPGPAGVPGTPGADGISVKKAELKEGNLILEFSNGELLNLGYIVGQPGSTGEAGLIGEQGPRGEPGDNGISITTAEVLNGDLLLTFSNGETINVGYIQGAPGIQGVPGDKGNEGPQGPAGIQGERGLKGDQGQTGKDGKDGRSGSKGERGNSGPPGLKGDKGEPGSQGLPGLPGRDGQDGNTPDIKPIADRLQKDVDAFKKQISAQISRINLGASSGGGGEVRFLRLDDVDTTNLGANRFVRYNAATSKLEFVSVSPGGGASNFSELTGTVTEVQLANNINISKFVNNANYANTSQLDAYISVANADSKFATIGYAASNTFVVQQLAGKVSSIQAGNNVIITGNSTVLTISSTGTGGGAGAPSDSVDLVFANDNAIAYKVVALNANAETVLASVTNISQVNKILGIIDDSGNTVTLGIIENPSWLWSPESSLYLGSSGDITTVSAIDGATFSVSIGYAITSTKVFVRIGTPIIL
jgi:hypothetical protein